MLGKYLRYLRFVSTLCKKSRASHLFPFKQKKVFKIYYSSLRSLLPTQHKDCLHCLLPSQPPPAPTTSTLTRHGQQKYFSATIKLARMRQ